MFLSDLTNRGSTPALAAMLSYTQQRHGMIARNIANIDTPGYQAERLDPEMFQKALGEALRDRRSDAGRRFGVRSAEQFEVNEDGSVRVRPVTTPLGNVMFHDGTTLSIEQEMSDLASNAMMHQTATSLLRGHFERLMTAIRGRI